MVRMVFEKIQEVLASQFEVDAEKITRETDIMGDLGADSLDIVELITDLEDEFSIIVTDESIYQCKTVGEMTDFIENLMG